MNFPIDAYRTALQLDDNYKRWRVMMDRMGSFAVVAALVLVSALHIISAPAYFNIVPAMLLVVGFIRLVSHPAPSETAASEDLSLAPTAEA
ncbi:MULTISPECIES: hypothetical protein [Sphingomonas]|nr:MULTISPECIES: hypothetical protein [Sphingomonas]MDY7525426.1 hypothetical protein [Sphingomonas sp. 10B4]MEB0281371.1 hypothetical protein [Sphingomonas sp. 10B4]